jgi:hypothetical protein
MEEWNECMNGYLSFSETRFGLFGGKTKGLSWIKIFF